MWVLRTESQSFAGAASAVTTEPPLQPLRLPQFLSRASEWPGRMLAAPKPPLLCPCPMLNYFGGREQMTGHRACLGQRPRAGDSCSSSGSQLCPGATTLPAHVGHMTSTAWGHLHCFLRCEEALLRSQREAGLMDTGVGEEGNGNVHRSPSLI